MKCFGKKQQGFTLLEMSIVLFIISLLILIVLPNLTSQRQHASKIHRDAMATVVQTQVDEYLNEHDKQTVSYRELEQAHYLTSSQVKKARGQGLVITNGQVVKHS